MSMKTNNEYWEWLLHNLSDSFHKLFKEEKKYLQKIITPDAKVLEVGCGDGRSIFDILPVTKNITGIDNDNKAISNAKNNLSNYSSIKIIKADATKLPFKDKEFDFVVCIDTFVNFADKKFIILEEMKRVLKNSGKIIFSVYSDEAKSERIKVYDGLKIKFEEIEQGTFALGTGKDTVISEQFSKAKLEDIFSRANLQIDDITKVNIAYLCTLSK
jgi:ubiquinone/menaquinone biosynthesis C-methylase UbiE